MRGLRASYDEAWLVLGARQGEALVFLSRTGGTTERPLLARRFADEAEAADAIPAARQALSGWNLDWRVLSLTAQLALRPAAGQGS